MSEHDTDAVVGRAMMAHSLALADRKSMREMVVAVLSALKPGDRLPGGGVWMPEEPTNAMLARVGEYWGQDTGYCSPEDVRAIYRAMLAAAGDPA